MFNIGDKVRIKPGAYPPNRFKGEAIYRGDSTTTSDCVALERLDGVKGGAQNSWWKFLESDLDMLEVVEPYHTESYPLYYNGTFYYLTITPSDEQNKSAGKTMQKITSKIKRIFSPSLQKQYKAGLIDNCGNLTSEGREEVDMLLRDLVNDELTKRAEEIIKDENK
jgi:hypothetical protein